MQQLDGKRRLDPRRRQCTAIAAYQYEAGFTLFSPLFASDMTDQMNNVPNITVFRSR